MAPTAPTAPELMGKGGGEVLTHLSAPPQTPKFPPPVPFKLTPIGIQQRVVHGGHVALGGAVVTTNHERFWGWFFLGGGGGEEGGERKEDSFEVLAPKRGVFGPQNERFGDPSPMLELRLLRGLAQVTSVKKRRSWE